MQNVFSVQPLVQPGFFRRLLHRPDPRNGYIELENLLASRPWTEIHHGHVEQVLRAHGVMALDRARAKGMYGRAVAAFVQDDLLTEAEVAGLRRLRELLGIRDSEADEAERQIVHPRYQRRIGQVLRDETVTEAERAELATLRKALRVDERTALTLWEQAAEPILTRRWEEAVSDRRLSDDERHALGALAGNFGIRVDVSGATKAQLDRFHWYWLTERGTFPDVAAGINLQRGEVCHFSGAAQMYEMRTETQRVQYASASVRIKIMKGVYYRIGSTTAQRITRDVLREIDRGTLYVTSKRVVFDGSRKNTTIRLANVLSIVPYSDGVEIEKTSGRNPIFTVDDPEWLTVLLSSRLAFT